MIDPGTTWLGLLGGGVSGSVIGGGSVYQIDLWHMGGNPLPARVLVTGKRLGVVAQLGTGHAALLVTGVRSARELEGLTSSGIDWEFSVGLKGSAIVKTGSTLFKTLVAHAAAETVNWAAHETGKRFAQWVTDDLGVVKPGKQFNLIPSPVAFGIGAGIFYEWQTMSLLSGNVGWQHISPTWKVENAQGNVYLSMFNIPEQDGTLVRLGFGVDELGFDPYIRWKTKSGDTRIDSRNKIQIKCYSYGGQLFDNPRGRGLAGINLSKILPIGRSQAGMLSVERNSIVEKNKKVSVYPVIFKFGNYPYWTADDTMKVKTASDGAFSSVEGTTSERD